MGFQNVLSGDPLPLSFDSSAYLLFLLTGHMVSPTTEANPVSLTWTQILFRFFLKKCEAMSSSSEEHSFCLGLRLYHFLAV